MRTEEKEKEDEEEEAEEEEGGAGGGGRRQYIKTAATDGRNNRNSYWHAPAPTAHSTSLTHPDENASLYQHFNVALPP